MQILAPQTTALLENIRIAYHGELNAASKYAVFAGVADHEGWLGVATLFRAASAAESIHAGNHGRIFRQLSGDTDYVPDAVTPRGTLENLRTALAGELYEVESMYPDFIEQAQLAGDPSVIRTFTWALEAEKTHARLFNEALTLVELNHRDSWATMVRPCYVCPVCGYTSEVPDQLPLCPACKCSWKRFEAHH